MLAAKLHSGCWSESLETLCLDGAHLDEPSALAIVEALVGHKAICIIIIINRTGSSALEAKTPICALAHVSQVAVPGPSQLMETRIYV
jgi:hypothetical protein